MTTHTRQIATGRLIATALTASVAALLGLAAPAHADDDHLVTPYGDVGLRYELLLFQEANPIPGQSKSELRYNQPELQYHLGLKADIVEDRIVADLRLSSGSATRPADAWQSLGDFGTGGAISLDRASLRATTRYMPELALELGKWPVPNRRTGLVWDEDVSLPGAGLLYSRDGARRAFFKNARASSVVHLLSVGEADGGDEILMFNNSVGATLGLSRSWSIDLDLAYYDLLGRRRLGRSTARGLTGVGRQNDGYTTNTTDSDLFVPRAEISQRLIIHGYGSDFNVASAYLAVNLDHRDFVPLALITHVTQNLGTKAAGDGQGFGLVESLQLGRADEDGAAELVLSVLHIAADAVLANYNHDAWLTNTQGLEARGALQLFDGLKLGFQTLYTQQIEKDLRGLGDDRGEPQTEDPTAVRLRVFADYRF